MRSRAEGVLIAASRALWVVGAIAGAAAGAAGCDHFRVDSFAGSKILLSIISLREKRPLDAHRWLLELARDYPDNPLFRKELVKIAARLGLNAN